MELLKKLTMASGVSGIENSVREILIDELKGIGELSISPMGNLTLHIKGDGEKILFAAHMDEIGVMITYIEEDGFLRFTSIGGLRTGAILHSRVVFPNGVIGVIACGDKKELKDLKIEDMFIDIGAGSMEEAEKLVPIGTSGVFCGEFIQRGDFITSKALDNRVGCYILAQAAKNIKNNQKDLYFVFTVQEELGLRGAKTAAYDIMPDYAIAIDVTACGGVPDGYKMAVRPGDGVAIKVRDSHIIAHPKVKEMLAYAANEAGVKFQYEVLEFGGTDAGALQSCGGGIPSGALSIPIRYVHTVNETASISDIEDAVKIFTIIGN